MPLAIFGTTGPSITRTHTHTHTGNKCKFIQQL